MMECLGVYDKIFIALGLKDFYISVECMELGLDPASTHLVILDLDKTDTTPCLAVSPSLRAYGIPNHARVFELNNRLN